ncbi:Crinkler (CRN) family protein [Phytophthora infestans T30-4]|uniref:Crinkler (CRN) family protein n=1 Tax=Phytophthora infestans (strain T30-4) TaxID=403677 RepID=D0N6B0_PHYIT|nr:Crinkler (CRN) family protein [Phytophthora infestans T30-4]EEY70601.1 Crinkler (CRN) family protein [Phytophthora infestans T30-4]|eukprot:XP_002998255.1 Crinkler (CRN) family protein [Phytophthora infestans T30-4]
MKLFCAIVGVAGSVFSVRVDESDSVDDLKEAIKAKKPNDFKDVDAYKLQLFLAKTEKGNGAWLTEKDVKEGVSDTSDLKLLGAAQARLRLVGLSDRDVGGVDEKEAAEGRGPVNVVVVARTQILGKRTRSDEWFIDQIRTKTNRVRVDDDEPYRVTTYFEMAGFPPLAHPKTRFTKIMERDAYVVIFTELMNKAKLYLDKDTGGDCSMVVTGNPGIGKSRFYLYCIFHLIFRTKVEVKELPSFDLVLNYGKIYHKFDAESHKFIKVNDTDISGLQREKRVIRLIEGTSSELAGWHGISILFAPPGVKGIQNFSKVDTFRYIMPVWTLAELREYNSLLQDDLKLSDDVLISRFHTFGGIPRFVFTQNEPEETAELQRAVASFSALQVIALARSKSVVRENNCSHRILQMVPSAKDLRVDFYLDFLSNQIAETIIDQVDQESFQKVAEFAVAHDGDDSGSTSVLRSKIYELLCHKWFSLPKQHKLVLRPLGDGHASVDVSIPRELKTVRFFRLADIKAVESGVYYWPTSNTFGALGAFVFVGNACYGLQMTLNRDHGIKAAPLNAFIKWLKGVGIATDRLYLTFVVSSHLESEFKKQSIRTGSDSDSKRPGAAAKVNQFVASLDVIVERGQ